MSTEARLPHGPPGILGGAGALDPEHASSEWQEHCRRTFRADVDLDELETAQREYREVLELRAETLPYEKWLKWRPRYVKPQSYWVWIEVLKSAARELEDQFGANLLAAGPAISDQRQRPH